MNAEYAAPETRFACLPASSSTRTDSETARQALIQANLRLVAYTARQYRSDTLAFEDLMQEGTIGLINAVDRFDPSHGVRFSTYALYWIRQAILKALTERGALIRVPTHVQDNLRRLRRAHQGFCERMGRSPSREEWAQAGGLTVEQVNDLLAGAMSIISLETPISGEQETRLGDTLRSPETDDPALQAAVQSLSHTLHQALETLNPQEQEIIRLRYGLDGEEPRSLEEISRARRVSRERIHQIEVRALQKLRRHQLLREPALI